VWQVYDPLTDCVTPGTCSPSAWSLGIPGFAEAITCDAIGCTPIGPGCTPISDPGTPPPEGCVVQKGDCAATYGANCLSAGVWDVVFTGTTCMPPGSCTPSGWVGDGINQSATSCAYATDPGATCLYPIDVSCGPISVNPPPGPPPEEATCTAPPP
jgi:hypothetical protein